MFRETEDCHAFTHPSPPRPRLPELSLVVRLADGSTTALRPLRRGEDQVLDEVFGGMSAHSRRQRFLVPMPRLPGASRRILADVDGDRHVAWVALVGGHPVGISRYFRTAPGMAEVAFEVVDGHQGRGIGAALLDALTTDAGAHGITTLEATVDPDNARSVALLTSVGIRLMPVDGLLEGRGPLRLMEPARVDRLAVLDLAARPV